MKKITSVLLITCIILSALAFTACSCDHDWVMIENVSATCEKDGITVYKCSKCDLERQETATKLKHNWSLIENTATCTESGEGKYVCSRCNQDRTETVVALGHNYASNGICNKCSKFKYNITVSNNLPYTGWFWWSGSVIYATGKIEKIEFTIEKNYYTYDQRKSLRYFVVLKEKAMISFFTKLKITFNHIPIMMNVSFLYL